VSGADAIDADASVSASGAATSAPVSGSAIASARPRSLDMGGLTFASDLDARLAASEAAATSTAASTTGAAPPKDAAALDAKIAAMPRGEPDAKTFAKIEAQLKGRVTTDETEEILSSFKYMKPDKWLGMIDKLKASPSDEKGLSLLDKFVKYGVNDRNRFIAEFADQANKNLGLGMPSLDERAKAHRDDGMRMNKADRVASREMRADADVLLDFFKANDKQGFVNGLRAVGETAGDVVKMPYYVVLALMGFSIG